VLNSIKKILKIFSVFAAFIKKAQWKIPAGSNIPAGASVFIFY